MDEHLLGYSLLKQTSSLNNPLITKSSISNTAISSSHISTKWRDTTVDDIASIEQLIDNEALEFFGKVDLAALIELSPYAVVIEDDLLRIVGFLCMNNYPNIIALLPEVWSDWMRHHYKLNELQYGNTLFVHYIVYDHSLRVDYLNMFLEDLFMNDVNLEYVCLVAPPGEAGVTYARNPFVKLLFSRALPFGSYTGINTQTLHICFRSSLVSNMKIRRALPEDNDDLVEILDTTASKLRSTYGDYYIAEIVSKKEPNRSIIVAEVNNQSVGMMCLNTNVDLEKLNTNFELLPFHALRKYRFNMGIEKRQVREILLRESLMFFTGMSLEDWDTPRRGTRNYTDSSLFSIDDEIQLPGNTSEAAILQTVGAPISESSLLLGFDLEVMAEWEEVLRKFTDRKAYYDEHVKAINLPLTEPNVMAIELFGISSELDERVSIDLLKAAFDTYRDRDYCLLTLPAAANKPNFLNYFTRAIPRSECSFPDNLYVIHKNNLAGTVDVSYLKRENLPDIYNLVDFDGDNRIEPAEDILRLCVDFVSNPESIHHALIIRSEQTLVGVIILRPADKVEHLRLNYCLDAYENKDIICLPEEYGQIAYSYICPLFVSSAPFIFKELFRITGFKSVYYLLPNMHGFLDFYNTLLPVLFPMKPRPSFNFLDVENFGDIETDPLTFPDVGTSAAYYTNIRLCTFQRKNIDERIVVIGFGQTSKTFLEALIYRQESQHLRFTDITCICPAGVLEADLSSVSNFETLFSPDRLFSKEYLKQLELRVWVNFIPGYMTDIDRKMKYVILDKKERVPYDKLFLFCGVQFDVPLEVYSAKKTPANLVLINKLIHGKMVNFKIKNLVQKSGCKIIVYGNLPKAFAGVNYLLSAGIKGNDIHFLTPPLLKKEDQYSRTFDDDYVEYCVFQEMYKAGVNVHVDYQFVTWSIDEPTNMIKMITFESTFECIKLSCALFFCYNRKVVNKLAVKALNRSGLVFDGRLVIDADNVTNDPNIFAAGPLTKYRRILYADRFRHRYYNSLEIGIKLATKLVSSYSQSDTDGTKSSNSRGFKWTVPHYSHPIVESITLPGNYYYLHVRRPGFQLPNYVSKTLSDYGMDLITGGPAIPQKAPSTLDKALTEKLYQDQDKLIAGRDYCRIYLDKNGFVKTIVCLTKTMSNGQNMIKLWGLHEKLLNSMKCKYLNGEITDFFEYFSERWANILHHDRFFKLQEMNERIYRQNLDGNSNWLNEVLRLDTTDHKQELTQQTREALIKYYQSEEFVDQIQHNLIAFINEHKETLFMYATPEIIEKKFTCL